MTETTIPLPEPPTEKRKPGRPRKVAAPLESVGGIPPTPLPGESTLPPSALQPEGSRQRTRMGRKRLRFTKLPRPAYPVRALWDLATPEEKQPITHTVAFNHAAAPPPAAVLAAMSDAGFKLTHLYGLTETYGPATINEWKDEWDKLSKDDISAKKIRQGVRYVALEGLTVMNPETMEVVSDDGETLGEVMFRGNIVMKGYLKNPKATQEAFQGGWFHSGDLGVLHPDGYIQLKDRSKDIIISGGENISSIEVEDVLYKHPAVAFCAVVAKPDEKWGETPCAFVELKPGATASADEIIEWCKQGLARYKVPRHVVFADVPRTSTGKIQKFKLRELAKAAE